MARDEPCAYAPQNRKPTHKVRVGALAARQFGHVTWAQLRALDITEARISRWAQTGYLVPVHRRVYAVGHQIPDEPSRLFSLVLFAGPGAGLSHGTGAHWRGWLRYPVPLTHISTPRQIRQRVPGVVFHCRRELARELVNGIPCTTVIQTLLDVAATEPIKLVRRSLAQLDYDRELDSHAIREACGRGRPGSAALLEGLNSYMPQLARTKSDLEDEFLYLCHRHKIPLPHVNTMLHGVEPDCHWPDLGLVVELDGGRNHGTGPQRTWDQRKALKLRAHGLTVIRYTQVQVSLDHQEVAADLGREMERLRRLTYPA